MHHALKSALCLEGMYYEEKDCGEHPLHSYLRSEAASERVDLALRLCAVSCGSADGADAAGHPGLPAWTLRAVSSRTVLASSQQQVRANRRGLTVVYQYGTVQVFQYLDQGAFGSWSCAHLMDRPLPDLHPSGWAY